jgi:hypothetical protein
MKRPSKQKPEPAPQFEKFKKLAEEAGCEDNDAAFDKTLKRLAETPPPETVEKRKLKLGLGGMRKRKESV